MSLHEQFAARRSLGVTEITTGDDDRRRAGTFFLGWLVLAASMSLAGNVGHALLIAPSETRWLAALASLVPPIVLLAATHSATWLVRARSVGWVYCLALALTAALALGSFALSFDALRSFAVILGIRESMSWIWPAVIDVAIAHATLCLLSLTRPKRNNRGSVPVVSATETMSPADPAFLDADGTRGHTTEWAESSRRPVSSDILIPPVTSPPPNPSPGTTGDALDTDVASTDAGTAALIVAAPAHQATSVGAVHAGPERGLSSVPAAEAAVTSRGVQRPHERDAECDTNVHYWQPVAESLVRRGITTKEPDLIAKILADNAAGTPPSTIGRRHEVHHTTVNRILVAAEQLCEVSTATG